MVGNITHELEVDVDGFVESKGSQMPCRTYRFLRCQFLRANWTSPNFCELYGFWVRATYSQHPKECFSGGVSHAIMRHESSVLMSSGAATSMSWQTTRAASNMSCIIGSRHKSLRASPIQTQINRSVDTIWKFHGLSSGILVAAALVKQATFFAAARSSC